MLAPLLSAGLPTLSKPCYIPVDAAVAQLVEQRIRNAWVGGSNPFRGTSKTFKNVKLHRSRC
jgi:hypothetical protein